MMNKTAIAAFALALTGMAGTAAAEPLTLPGDTPIYFQFNNLEQVSPNNDLVVPGYAPAAGDLSGNWGVFNISSVQIGGILPGNEHIDIGGGSGFFLDDGVTDLFGQGQISGIFWGLDFTSATTATGGYLDLYWEDAATDDITSGCMSGGDCGPDATTVGLFTDGVFLARLYFDTGIIVGDNSTTLASDVNPTLGVSGQADAFASVDTSVVGLWTDVLNGDWFWVDVDGDGVFGEADERRDVRFSTFFNATADHWDTVAGNNSGLRSNDPARVFTSPIPEPATLTLFGVGLGLAALAARRRKKVA